MTLVNKILYVSGVQFDNISSIYCIEYLCYFKFCILQGKIRLTLVSDPCMSPLSLCAPLLILESHGRDCECTQWPAQSLLAKCTPILTATLHPCFYHYLISDFFKDFIYIYFRERGREGDRAGANHQCERATSISYLLHTPKPGTGLQPSNVS